MLSFPLARRDHVSGALNVYSPRHLERALDSRAVIDQAKGVLMERFTLGPEQAFQVLTRCP